MHLKKNNNCILVLSARSCTLGTFSTKISMNVRLYMHQREAKLLSTPMYRLVCFY